MVKFPFFSTMQRQRRWKVSTLACKDHPQASIQSRIPSITTGLSWLPMTCSWHSLVSVFPRPLDIGQEWTLPRVSKPVVCPVFSSNFLSVLQMFYFSRCLPSFVRHAVFLTSFPLCFYYFRKDTVSGNTSTWEGFPMKLKTTKRISRAFELFWEQTHFISRHLNKKMVFKTT